MDSSFEASDAAIIASVKHCIKELQKFLSNAGFHGLSDPFAGVREPKKTAPTGGRSSVAVPEPEPETRVDAVAHR